MDRSKVSQQVRASLEERPLQKAREIAGKMGVPRSSVNSVLYGELCRDVQKDNNNRWALKITKKNQVGTDKANTVPHTPIRKKPKTNGTEEQGKASAARSKVSRDPLNREVFPEAVSKRKFKVKSKKPNLQTKQKSKEAPQMSEFDPREEQALRNLLNESRSRLLDKTRRNRLLNFRETKKDVAIIDEVPNQVFEHLVLNDRHFYFDPIEVEELEISDNSLEAPKEVQTPERTLPSSFSESALHEHRYNDDRLQTPYTERDLDRRLYRLYLEHRSLIQETGANCLFLAIGYIRWSETDDDKTSSSAPLILLPVRLERNRRVGAAVYELHFDDEAIDTNYSLFEKLRQDFGITLPELEDEQLPEDYWAAVDQAIPERRRGSWTLVREMTLGLFRFHKQIMWHDLNPERWPKHAPITSKPMIERILLGPKENQTPPGKLTVEYSTEGVDGKEVPLILDADPSQYSALFDALEKNSSLVIEGPPGTGKSQTIANLIAAAMSDGKTVLFVAEKMAALEVVFSRLQHVGLGDFCLQLHGLRTSKRELLDSLKERFEYQATSRLSLNNEKEQLEAARKKLRDFSEVMSVKVGPDHEPLYDVIWKRERLVHRLPEGYFPSVEKSPGNASQFRAYGDLLEDLATEYAATPKDVRDAWFGFEPQNIQDQDQRTIEESVKRQLNAIKSLRNDLEGLDYDETREQFASVSWMLQIADVDCEELMPPIPEGTLPKGFRSLLDGTSRDTYRRFLDEVHRYLKDIESVNVAFDYLADDSGSIRDFIQDYLVELPGVCISSELEFEQISRELRRHAEVITQLNLLEKTAQPITRVFDTSLRTLSDAESLIEKAKTICGGPAALSLKACQQHALASATNYFKDGQSRSKAIIRDIAACKQFKRNKNLSSEALKAAHFEISLRSKNPLAFLSRHYREAKALIRETLQDPTTFSKKDVFLNSLDDFIVASAQAEQYGLDEPFSHHLGPAFRGIETEWDELEKLIQFSQGIRQQIGLDNAQTLLGDWDRSFDELTNTQEALLKSLDTLQKFKESHPYPAALWRRPITEILRTLEHWNGRLTALQNQDEWRAVSGTATVQQVINAQKSYDNAQRFETEVVNHPLFKNVIAAHWLGAETDIALFESYLSWLEARFEYKQISDSVLHWIFTEDGEFRKATWDKFHARAKNFSAEFSGYLSTLEHFGSLDRSLWLGGDQAKPDRTILKIEQCSNTSAYLLPISKWNALKQRTIQQGLGAFADALHDGVVEGAVQARSAFEYAVYSLVIKQVVMRDERLAEFGQTTITNLRERFSRLDKEMFGLTAKEIAKRLARTQIPSGAHARLVSDYTDKRLILNEIRKKSRHIPIRQLVRRASAAIQAAKPCFLMSPLSVAQYLAPGQIEFDLVVMDEASQIRPEDALGAIARGAKTIVVGDPKQLPPTSFFDASSDDDETAEASPLDDTESILDVCLKQLPYRRLRWHYRSQHESLIQFSNDQFYDRDLIFFPSPKGMSDDLGVFYHFVEQPNYHKGLNRGEAQLVVQKIIEHYRKSPERSLGVAAFNRRQAEEIDLLLEKVRQERPDIDNLISNNHREEPLFVKNLENVQGDERDVIFISTTYGPAQAGEKVFQRFGPINSPTGWRRLNVIATRAKQRVDVFTSMQSSDIIVGPTSTKGVVALKNYLAFAQTRKIPVTSIPSGGEPESPFEVSVGKILTDLGYKHDPQVGVEGFFIDIGVKNPVLEGEYLIGIECDGARYHSAKSVRDRDRLRQEILEAKGWKIHRIWSTNWYHAREAEIDKLRRVLEEATAATRKNLVVPEVSIDESQIEVDLAEFSDEVQEEGIALEEKTLEAALDRFWDVTVKPKFPNKTDSILCDRIIPHLVSSKPETREAWFRAVPLHLREAIPTTQAVFLDDILELISEFA